MEKNYKYLGYLFLLLIPLILFGFYKTYFIQFPDFEEIIDPFIHVHTILASSWVAILIIQPLLILNKKVSIHKQLGKISNWVFVLLVLSFIPGTIKNINNGSFSNLFFTFGDGLMLILFYTLAIYNKRKSSIHMRYMIAAATVLINPTLGRIFFELMGIPNLQTGHLVYTIILAIFLSLIFP